MGRHDACEAAREAGVSELTGRRWRAEIGSAGGTDGRFRELTSFVGRPEELAGILEELRGIYRNRFTRVLLVSFATLMGSALGGWVGAGWLLRYLDKTTAMYAGGALLATVLASWLLQRKRAD